MDFTHQTSAHLAAVQQHPPAATRPSPPPAVTHAVTPLFPSSFTTTLADSSAPGLFQSSFTTSPVSAVAYSNATAPRASLAPLHGLSSTLQPVGSPSSSTRAPPRFPPGFRHTQASPPPVGYGNIFSTSSSSSVYAMPQLSAPNLSNLVTITPSSPEDYLLWKTQITCLLLSHQLLGMVEGTVSIPPPTIIDEHGVSIPNSSFYEYLRWVSK